MRFPLTKQLIEESARYSLRSACRDCTFWNSHKRECWHGWPDEGQSIELAELAAAAPADVPPAAVFCKEFELR